MTHRPWCRTWFRTSGSTITINEFFRITVIAPNKGATAGCSDTQVAYLDSVGQSGGCNCHILRVGKSLCLNLVVTSLDSIVTLSGRCLKNAGSFLHCALARCFLSSTKLHLECASCMMPCSGRNASLLYGSYSESATLPCRSSNGRHDVPTWGPLWQSVGSATLRFDAFSIMLNPINDCRPSMRQ